MVELLQAAAAALDDNRDPLSHSFLAEHEVTADECFTLGDLLAAGAHMIAWMMENPKIAAGAFQGMRVDKVGELLRRMNERPAT
jgi:hypothetical protein